MNKRGSGEESPHPIEVFLYLGKLTQPGHTNPEVGMHIWMHTNTGRALTNEAGSIYNAMIQEDWLEDGDTLVLFDICAERIFPFHVFHTSGARMEFDPRQVWTKVVETPRGSRYLIMEALYKAEAAVAFYIYSDVEVPTAGPLLQRMKEEVVGSFAPIETFMTTKERK